MSRITKKLITMVLAVGFIVSLFSSVTTCVFAATEITNIALTGDITPSVGQAMTFAEAADNPNYTIVQVWMNGNNGKGFTNSDYYNADMDEFLITEAERLFSDKTTYTFAVMIIPQSTDVKFASDMKVSVGPYENMQYLGDAGNGMVAYQLVFNIDSSYDHVHVKSNVYGVGNDSHWGKCIKDDGYIFDDTEEPHNIDDVTGVCKDCGFVASEEDKTKLVSQPNASITVDCGDSIELSVGATGSNLKYSWKRNSSRVDLYDSENYSNYGLKISGSKDAILTIENCNLNIENLLPIVCQVTGMWGEAETEEINVEVNHSSKVYEAVDGTGHKVKCDCGKLVLNSEEHTYNSENVCEKCGYEKGSARTRLQSVTFTLSDYSDKNTVADAKKSAALSGVGIKADNNGISEIKFMEYSKSDGYKFIGDTTKFSKNGYYRVQIYPILEENFYMNPRGAETTGSVVFFQLDGKTMSVVPDVDDEGKCYLSIPLEKPYVRRVARFSSNGGEGKQEDVYADEHGSIYFPQCQFYKADDEFYAWEYNGKLYAEDPNEYVPVHIEEEYAEIKAVWQSELINSVELTMDYPNDGDKVSDVGFYSPVFDNRYSVSGVTWYLDDYQEVLGEELGLMLGDDSTLDRKKDYNVVVSVKGTGFALGENLKVRLNNRSIEETAKNGLQTISFVLHIKGGTNITFIEPTDGIALDSPSEMTINNDIVAVDSENTYWSRNDNESGKYAENSIAAAGEQYYLSCWLNYTEEAKNTILFGSTVSINGTEYDIKKIGNDYIRIVVPFTGKKLQVTVSEKNGLIYIESPKAMTVTFVMALYSDSGMTLKELMMEELELTKGKNEINFVSLNFQKGAAMVYRKSSESVKAMVFEGNNIFKPLGSAYNYRYKQSIY